MKKFLLAGVMVMVVTAPAFAGSCERQFQVWDEQFQTWRMSCLPTELPYTTLESDPTTILKGPEDPPTIADAPDWLLRDKPPYEQGVSDYYDGRCYRARPEFEEPKDANAWEKGFHSAQHKDHNRVDRSHCSGRTSGSEQ
jgi:hypothetical protein